jgi:hypothetical protein
MQGSLPIKPKIHKDGPIQDSDGIIALIPVVEKYNAAWHRRIMKFITESYTHFSSGEMLVGE